MHTPTPAHPASLAAGLGRRHSRLLHSVLFGAEFVQSGVYRQQYREGDERSSVYQSVADVLRDQADQLDSIADMVRQFEFSRQSREFLAAAHGDSVFRLEWSWNAVYDKLRRWGVDLPGKAARELDREPRDWFCDPGVDIGSRYADLTFWAVDALRDLHLSAEHPNRHRGNSEGSVTKEIRHTKALMFGIETTGGRFELVDGARVGAVVAQYDAQTRLRTRMFADEVSQRLRSVG